jgi:Zn finger protein HypA/HybF involved in hydrogenase expression
MPETSNTFARATGVEEQTRQCMAKGCHKYFRSANEHDTACPHCGSDQTRDINEGHAAGEGRVASTVN